jgi:hypothetical protein
MQVWVEYEGEKVVVVEEFHKRWVVLHGQKKKITCLRNAYNNMVKESGIGFHYWLVKVNQLFFLFLDFFYLSSQKRIFNYFFELCHLRFDL